MIVFNQVNDLVEILQPMEILTSGKCEKFAFPTLPTQIHLIHELKRTSSHWFAGNSVLIPLSDFTQHPQAHAHKTDGWETRMKEGSDVGSVSSSG